MNPKPLDQETARLFARTLPALLRARKRAEQIAAETHTAVVDMLDGKLVFTYPKKNEPQSAE
ncbi:MAG TPA: hypothetical protein VGM44_23690 [Polyangiaceae bacterium]|jgi:hypothetical protein